MELQRYIDHMPFASNFSSVERLIDIARPGVTFWGARVITVNGKTGSVYLMQIVSRVLVAYRHDPFYRAKKENVLRVLNKLAQLLDTTDEVLQNANLITRIFNCIREYFLYKCGEYYRFETFSGDEVRQLALQCANN